MIGRASCHAETFVSFHSTEVRSIFSPGVSDHRCAVEQRLSMLVAIGRAAGQLSLHEFGSPSTARSRISPCTRMAEQPSLCGQATGAVPRSSASSMRSATTCREPEKLVLHEVCRHSQSAEQLVFHELENHVDARAACPRRDRMSQAGAVRFPCRYRRAPRYRRVLP